MKVTVIKSGSLGLADGSTKLFKEGEQEVTKEVAADLANAGMTKEKPAPKSRKKANG